MPIPVSSLIAGAAPLFGVTPDDITGPSRRPCFTHPRFAVCLAARVSGRSYNEIGRIVGGRDHKTIMHACEQGENWYRRSPEFRAIVDTLLALSEEWQGKHKCEPLPRKVVDSIKAQVRFERNPVGKC